MSRYRRPLLGAASAAALVAVLTAAMVPLRDHLSVASAGLVLVVPVVAGVAVGGLTAGMTAVAAGFFAYDLVFIPPYGTLAVGAAQNWVALVVYVVVLVVVATVVADQRRARAEARLRERETRRLLELSQSLSADAPDLADQIVLSVVRTFRPRWAALLVPGDGELAVAAAAGPEVDVAEILAVAGQAGTPVHLLDEPGAGPDPLQPVAVALVAGDAPAGLLAVAPAPLDRHDRQLLGAFANHAAIAVERARLREQAVRAQVLEAQEQATRTLLRTVSHDLRTPLATVKAALSEVRSGTELLRSADRDELLALAEDQADRLDRLVANLLDINRIEAGSLALHRDAVPVADLLREVLASLGDPPVAIAVPTDLPPVDADHTLIGQALANLVDNALRHAPGSVEVRASRHGGSVVLAVVDRGPGIARGGDLDRLRSTDEDAPPHRAGIRPQPSEPAQAMASPTAAARPEPGARPDGHAPVGGPPPHRGGLGLTIAQAFVEAHGASLELRDTSGGGATFAFALPAVPMDAVDTNDGDDATPHDAHGDDAATHTAHGDDRVIVPAGSPREP